MRCLPMRQQQSCCRHAAQPYIPLWGPYIPSINRKWMFRQIGSGYHYCQLVHGPLANFPHTKNSVLAVTTRRLELGLAAVLAALPLLCFLLCFLIAMLFSHCYALITQLFSLLTHYHALISCLLLNSCHCSLITMLSSHACTIPSHCFTLFVTFSFPFS